MKKLTGYNIDKNFHFSFPRTPFLTLRNKKLRITFCPTKDGIYELPNDDILKDQNDFNKGGGVVFNPMNPDKNSALLGWRWNKEKKKFQYLPYFNVDGANVFDETKLIEADPNDDITMTLVFDKDSITSTISIGEKSLLRKIFYNKTKVPFILWGSQPYFGGNKKAPKDLTVYMNYERF